MTARERRDLQACADCGKPSRRKRCPDCRAVRKGGSGVDRRIAELEAQIVELKGQLAAWEQVTAEAVEEWAEEASQAVDWAQVAKLSDVELRNFARIAGRVHDSQLNPGGYALRWVLENRPR